MVYAEEVQKARRLAILLQLYFAPGYTAALDFVRNQVERTGYASSLDQIATDLAWLKEQGLVVTTKHGAHRLSDRGVDVCLARVETPGVLRPRPDEIPE
ncbi:hypothetical protein DLREEDagrD3_28830 [Denitratisoma sp. agr-D3]